MSDDDTPSGGARADGRIRRQRRDRAGGQDSAGTRQGGGGKGGGGKNGGGQAGVKGQAGARLMTGRGRKASSRAWLERQIKDPYVGAAKQRGYRSRAAFKLAEMDDKHHILRPGQRVVDLGAAPGGWCQVAAERIGAQGRVVGLDLLPIDPLPGVTLLEGDITEPESVAALIAALDGPADVVLSDMAPNATGHHPTDQVRVIAVVEAALDLADDVLVPGGAFLAKTLQLGGAQDLMTRLKRDFAKVRHVKPPASRADSAELYLLATGYRGAGAAG